MLVASNTSHLYVRRNFVFCGDAVPREPGNGTYIKDCFGKLGSVLDGRSVLDDRADKSIMAIVEKFFGAKINALFHNLGKYEHCSQLIYTMRRRRGSRSCAAAGGL